MGRLWNILCKRKWEDMMFKIIMRAARLSYRWWLYTRIYILVHLILLYSLNYSWSRINLGLSHNNLYLYKIVAKLSCFRPFTLKLFLVTIFLFKNDLKLFRQATDIFSARNYAADWVKNASKFIWSCCSHDNE